MKYEANAAETNVFAMIAQYGIKGTIERHNLILWEVAVARSMAKKGLLIQNEDSDGYILSYSLTF